MLRPWFGRLSIVWKFVRNPAVSFLSEASGLLPLNFEDMVSYFHTMLLCVGRVESQGKWITYIGADDVVYRVRPSKLDESETDFNLELVS